MISSIIASLLAHSEIAYYDRQLALCFVEGILFVQCFSHPDTLSYSNSLPWKPIVVVWWVLHDSEQGCAV